MSWFNDEIIRASDSEKLIWSAIKKDGCSSSNTLSYRFDIKANIAIDEVQSAIYLLLTEYCTGFNHRFFEIDSILYKQLQIPSLRPVTFTTAAISTTKKKFDAKSACLYFFEWQEVPEGGGVLWVHLSHLIFDGASYPDFCIALTKAFDNSEDKKIPVTDEILDRNDKESATYWRDQLKNKSITQSLPFMPIITDRAFISTRRNIDKACFLRLKKFSQQHDATVFQIMMTSLAILIHTYLFDKDEHVQSELVLSYCLSQRRKNQPIACYLKILPLFVACKSGDSISKILEDIKFQRQQHRNFQHISFDEFTFMIDEPLNRHQELFNVIVNHSPGLLPLEAPVIKGIPSTVMAIDSQSGQQCLSLVYNFNESEMVIQFESNRGEFAVELLNLLANNFEKTLDFVTRDINSSVDLLHFNTPKKPVSIGRITPRPVKTLAEHMLSVAKKSFAKIAIQSQVQSMSYDELIYHMQCLRQELKKFDINLLKKGVGIYLSRECHLPLAMLSCIFESVMFIPLAIELPDLVIEEVINNTDLSVLIVDGMTFSRLKKNNDKLKVIQINDLLKQDVTQPPLIELPETHSLQDIAYTLFTSGSTGKPKGVMVSYTNLLNFFNSMTFKPGLNSADTLLAMTPVSFDISITELLLPLFCGATVYIIDEHIRKDVTKLATVIDTQSITIIQATPSSCLLLKNHNWIGRRQLTLWVGGEALSSSLAAYFLNQGHQLFNMYGPTETTIWASTSEVINNTPIVIGTAVDNSALYVLDKNGNTPALGIPGQLFITGACVSEGYSNQQSDAFVTTKEGLKGYFTGDRVVAFGQDKIQYLERIDDQVKVKGHRVELNEISEKIKLIVPEIDVVTVLREKPEPHLCCFYTNSDMRSINTGHILKQLKHIFPYYKVPQALIYLPEFPLTTSGKIDKKALAAKAIHSDSQIKVVSRNLNDNGHTEKLCELIEDHFSMIINDTSASLADYGFNSLSFNQLSLLISQFFSVSIPPHQFYRTGDIDAIAEYIRMQGKVDTSIAHMRSHKKRLTKKIAIVGYDCLMPGGLSADSFWESLINHDDLVGMHKRAWLNSNDKAGYIDNIERFDRHFFKLSPLECARMDPRQRLLLQCAWKTLEHAGYAPSALRASPLSCFVAATGMDYLLAQNKSSLPPHPYSLSGNALTMLANRLSYYFDWQGPSMTLDTACSGSFTALIRACDQLCLTENTMAFVAGVNLIADEYLSEGLQAGNFLSKLGRCASFSEDADGYVRGEGVIGFLLKSLEDAERDGDTIHAVIESIAENHGGYAHSLTAPNQHAQTALLLQAYDDNLARKLSYIETHGTGTKLGDPIEIDAVKAFEEAVLGTSDHRIKLGSVKSNIGHLEAAAGFASLLKVILAMKHQQLPANLHFTGLNPLIDLEHSRLEILRQNETWDNMNELVAGVSSFGFGGANAHVVLSNSHMTMQTKIQESIEPCLIVLSAKSEASLKARIESLKQDLDRLPLSINLKNIAYTLAVGRDNFVEYRLAFIASNRDELLQKLNFSTYDDSSIPDTLLPYYNAYLLKESVDWAPLYGDKVYQRVALTPYVFDEKNYWYTSLLPETILKPALFAEINLTIISAQDCEISLASNHPFFEDHQVFKKKVLPGVAHIELAILVLKKLDIKMPLHAIEGFYWLRPVTVKTDIVKLVVSVKSVLDGYQVEFKDREGSLFSYGKLKTKTTLELPYAWLDEVKQCLVTKKPKRYFTSEIYEGFSALGIDYGSHFQCIDYVDVCDNVSQARLTINRADSSMSSLLDCALQSGMAISLGSSESGLMPFTLGAMIIQDKLSIETLNTIQVFTKKLSPFRTHIVVCDNDDHPLLSFIDLGVKASQLKKQ